MAFPKRRCFMPSAEPLRFEIEISAIGPPVVGWWRPAGTCPRDFTGWTELFAGLDSALFDTPIRDKPEDAPP